MPIHARDGRGRAIRTVEQIERDREAALLRSKSLTYREIGEHFDVAMETARDMVRRGMADVPVEGIEEARRIEVAKLDEMERMIRKVLEREHLTVSASGRLVTRQDGSPVLDDAPILASVDRLLKVQHRRAALLGLDAPERVEHTVLTLDAIDSLIAEAEAELGIESPAES